MKLLFLLCLVVFLKIDTYAQIHNKQEGQCWNVRLSITSHGLPPPPIAYTSTYIDLDNDGDVDVIKSATANNIVIAWIDDDDDRKDGAIEGNTDSDCLLVDRNGDGRYGALGDLVIDWIDNDKDNKANIQVADYPAEEKEAVWPNGHYLWMLDTDKDNIFNNID